MQRFSCSRLRESTSPNVLIVLIAPSFLLSTEGECAVPRGDPIGVDSRGG
jgi:hypothetical protein